MLTIIVFPRTPAAGLNRSNKMDNKNENFLIFSIFLDIYLFVIENLDSAASGVTLRDPVSMAVTLIPFG